MAQNFETHECVIFVQSRKIGTHENKAIHSIYISVSHTVITSSPYLTQCEYQLTPVSVTCTSVTSLLHMILNGKASSSVTHLHPSPSHTLNMDAPRPLSFTTWVSITTFRYWRWNDAGFTSKILQIYSETLKFLMFLENFLVSLTNCVDKTAWLVRVQWYIVSWYTAIRKVYDMYLDTQNQMIRITIQQVFFWLASKLNAFKRNFKG